MSKYLVSTTEIYRVDSEHEVDEIVEKATPFHHISHQIQSTQRR